MDVFAAMAEELRTIMTTPEEVVHDDLNFDILTSFTRQKNGNYRFKYTFVNIASLSTFIRSLVFIISVDEYQKHVRQNKIQVLGPLNSCIKSDERLYYVASFLTYKKKSNAYIVDIIDLNNTQCNKIYRAVSQL